MAAYGLPWREARSHEADHLIPLSLGGDPGTIVGPAGLPANIWPEPNIFIAAKPGPYAANDKDAVEAAAHDAVCDGRLSLRDAQRAFASDWTTLMPLITGGTP